MRHFAICFFVVLLVAGCDRGRGDDFDRKLWSVEQGMTANEAGKILGLAQHTYTDTDKDIFPDNWIKGTHQVLEYGIYTNGSFQVTGRLFIDKDFKILYVYHPTKRLKP